jgi:hypothetical protein
MIIKPGRKDLDWRYSEYMTRRLRIITALLVLLAAANCGVFFWAAQKSYSIGVNASDSGGNGDTDPTLWFFLCPVLAVILVATISVILSRHRRPGGR